MHMQVSDAVQQAQLSQAISQALSQGRGIECDLWKLTEFNPDFRLELEKKTPPYLGQELAQYLEQFRAMNRVWGLDCESNGPGSRVHNPCCDMTECRDLNAMLDPVAFFPPDLEGFEFFRRRLASPSHCLTLRGSGGGRHGLVVKGKAHGSPDQLTSGSCSVASVFVQTVVLYLCETSQQYLPRWAEKTSPSGSSNQWAAVPTVGYLARAGGPGVEAVTVTTREPDPRPTPRT
ncbi:hypothetical protein Taro_013843 [Colocasia esculenta]|uniref:Uncharacterized protein n=1 Tax=Colocasia esculenta TaxID=4460 RepID=A0A843UJY1_COLES|nr:hypothetical protein [Colocasia esculenta]